MNKETRLIFLGALAIIMFGTISSVFIKEAKQKTLQEEMVGEFACTMEAKVCPDGTYVGRIAPYCQFAECPSSSLSQNN